MKRSLAILALASVTTIALADGSPWTVSGAWDFRANQPVALVTKSVKSQTSGLFTFSLDGFAGVAVQAGSNGSQGLLGGSGLSLTYKVNTAVSLTGGAGFGVFAGDQPHPLVYGAVVVRF